MGRGKNRTVSKLDADALRDRFNIVKMDEGVARAGTELEDAAKFVEESQEEGEEEEEEEEVIDFTAWSRKA